MNTIRAVTRDDLSEEDRRILTEALNTWKSAGVSDPRIPAEVDVDGDGIVDAYALNGFGQLIYVTGVALDTTVYMAEGEGFEAAQPEVTHG